MTLPPCAGTFAMPCMRRCLLLLLLVPLFLVGCAPTRTLPVAAQSEASQWSRPLSNQPLRQTFVPPSGGTNGIEVVLALPEGAPALDSRPLEWQILDNVGEVLREGEVETARYQHNTPIRLNFEPLAGGAVLELSLTAPPDAGMALWTSTTDRYPQGTILDNNANNIVDLHFSLYDEETPLTLPLELRAAAGRWSGAALWIPLLLLGPGWLLAWLAHPAGARPVVPFAAGLSLALAPIVYLWLGWTGLRLYEPLVQSLFQASVLGLTLLMIRSPSRLREGWHGPWADALALLVLAIVLSVATWLLAARTLVAPAGESAVASGLLVQEVVREGRLEGFSAPLPPSIVAATMAQLSRQPIPSMLLLGGLLVGVSLVPALFALGMETSREPRAALWVVPLAWLWPTPWQMLESGELAGLYGLALLPVTVALGLRALRAAERPWRGVALAAVPLAALMLVQGVFALGAWAVAVALWAMERAVQRRSDTPAPSLTDAEHPAPPSATGGLALALFWLAGAGLLLLPAWLRGFGLEQPAALPTEYALLGVAVALAVVGGWLARRLGAAAMLVSVLVVLSLPVLVWWRSTPLPGSDTIPTTNEITVMQWARTNTPGTALILINVEAEGDAVAPTDSGMWLPLYGNRSTVLQADVAPETLAQAMEPGGIDDPLVREALQAAGVTHIFISEANRPLRAESLLNENWVRVAYQSGSAYLFELLTTPLPTPDEDDI